MRNELINISAAEYFADPGDVPSLSASTAKLLVNVSPLHAWAQHPKLGGTPPEPTRSMDRGSLIDSLLLSGGKEIVVVDAKDFTTKAAKAERDAAWAKGQIPIVAEKYDDAVRAVRVLKDRLYDKGITLRGQSQVVALWTERADDGTEVQCKGMLDHWTESIGLIDDLKVCESAHPNACQRHVDNYGYAIQRAAYVRAMEKLHPALVGRVGFRFLFCEEVPPTWAITPVNLSGVWRGIGEVQWRRAVNLWAQCLSSGEFPDYAPANETIELEPPPWRLAREMDHLLAAS